MSALRGLHGAVMVCGTGSDVGKSQVVAGLCRLLSRNGVRVAPFKAQNMALNSFVTASGHEIARAQAAQALAAGVEPEVAMNPILLKPTGERTSQVILLGRPLEPTAELDAASYHALKPSLLGVVLEALSDLRARFDVVVCEGAGSAAEINLSSADLVNLRLAKHARIPALVVGDIDRGGVFAALYGTVALLGEPERRLVRGFVVNKLRGDPSLLGDALGELERRCGVPTLGVLPFLEDVAIDAEDSLALAGPSPRPGGEPLGDPLDVAVLRLPRIANFTDFDALALEPGCALRFVDHPGALGDPDLVVLPGTKTTVADLAWVRRQGLDEALRRAKRRGSVLFGICGGYQMLGRRILDGVESATAEAEGLGLLDVTTVFAKDKLTRQRRGRAFGAPLCGYEIRHGRPAPGPTCRPFAELDDAYGTGPEGAVDPSGSVLGTSLHGVFDEDQLRAKLLGHVALRRGKRFAGTKASLHAAREARAERLADLLEQHLDIEALARIVAEGDDPGGFGGRSG